MLNPHEARIVAADPELPALRVILDEQAALSLIAKHVPDLQPTTARCTYLRYKPHNSCLAAFAVATGKSEQTFHLVAYRADTIDKLAKFARDNQTRDAGCTKPIVLPESATVISPFPYDRDLPALERVSTRKGKTQLLSRLAPEDNRQLFSAAWTVLRYKPGRRFVARLDLDNQPQAVLKLHSAQVYAQARRAAKSLRSLSGIKTARSIGHSDRHQALLLEWLRGESLANFIAENRLPNDAMLEVGRLLARFSAQQTTKLPHRSVATEIGEMLRSAEDLSAISPPIKGLLNEVSQSCVAHLSQLPQIATSIHGDCHPEQIVVNNSEIAIIDLDSAAQGHPANDLGNFLAHVQRDVLQKKIHASLGDQIAAELTAGYAQESSTLDHHTVQIYLAAGLLRLAHEPFRYRRQNWPEETEQLVRQASHILDKVHQRPQKNLYGSAKDMQVVDPFSVRNGNDLPHAATAIDFQSANETVLPVIQHSFDDESLELRSIHVLRHKPGRRCLIEYSCLSLDRSREVVVLGKIHAKSRHKRSYRLQSALWESGFDYASADGISVARPVGVIPESKMWLQERVSGSVCWDALDGPRGEVIAARIAEAAHKLHQTDLVTERIHSIDEELQILKEKLSQVVRLLPRLRSRIDAVLKSCQELAASIPTTPPTGIHRDFYPDQIMVSAERLYVLDHDLYCLGDPCLDIGNFCGHLIEHSLRHHGHPDAYATSQHAIVERFCSLRNGNGSDPAVIDAYTILTVVRHIYLSTRIAGRNSSTNAIFDYCEQALSCLTR